MFCNVNFSNLENFLQTKQKTDRSRECIFRASGDRNFVNFSGCGFDGCPVLPKKHSGYFVYL